MKLKKIVGDTFACARLSAQPGLFLRAKVDFKKNQSSNPDASLVCFGSGKAQFDAGRKHMQRFNPDGHFAQGLR